VPGVLFLPDLFYDHRIWADLPPVSALTGMRCATTCTSPCPGGNLTAWPSLVQAVRFGLARRASRMARAIADMAPDGRFIAAAADTDLVWLEDRTQAKAAITDMLVPQHPVWAIQHRRTS
jgi:hypothetical protein